MEDCRLVEAGRKCGVRMKPQNTIVDKWPMALKLESGQPGAQKEFDLLASTVLLGSEGYVEWERVETE